MAEPTDAELIAWCEKMLADERAHWDKAHIGSYYRPLRFTPADETVLIAIAARLRTPGKAEPPPAYDAQPAGVTVGNFGRKD